MLYVHAGGLDQPLGLIRMDYSHDFRTPRLVVPHANWRGMYEQGTIAGSPACKDVWLPTSEMVYMDSTGRRMVSPVVTGPDGQELDTLQTRCIEIDFPGKAANMRHLLRQNSAAGPIAWMGSVPQDAQDASGLMYRRNRFYDPRAGLAPDLPDEVSSGLRGTSWGTRAPFRLAAACRRPPRPAGT